MIQGSLSRRYANALLGLSSEMPEGGRVKEELAEFARLCAENPLLLHTLSNNTIRRHERKGVLEKILERLNPSRLTRSFLTLLVDKRRIGLIPEISRTFSQLADEKTGRLQVTLRSAKPVSDSVRKDLQAALSKKTGRQVDMEAVVSPEWIGGLSVQVANTIYDGTVATQLENLKRQMLENTLYSDVEKGK